MNEEIERKFLLDKLPYSIKAVEKEYIKQGYLAVMDGREVRIRQKGKHFYLTVKQGSGLRREEFEIPISKKQFNALWNGTKGYRLEKTRFVYKWKGYKLEIDQYHGDLKRLYTAECEFPGIADALIFPVPPFFREEITFDYRYKNQSLARTGKNECSSLLASGIHRSVIGTIPYLIKDNELKVVLVTRRNSEGWIFPKGQQEKEYSHREVALMEAEEEAGILGEIKAEAIRIPYRKKDEELNMLTFPVEVKKLKKSWDEMKERKRKVVSIKEAYELSDQPAVHCGLKYLEQMVL